MSRSVHAESQHKSGSWWMRVVLVIFGVVVGVIIGALLFIVIDKSELSKFGKNIWLSLAIAPFSFLVGGFATGYSCFRQVGRKKRSFSIAPGLYVAPFFALRIVGSLNNPYGLKVDPMSLILHGVGIVLLILTSWAGVKIGLAVRAATLRKQSGQQTVDKDVISQLERLATLKEKGVITDLELEEEKAKLRGKNTID